MTDDEIVQQFVAGDTLPNLTYGIYGDCDPDHLLAVEAVLRTRLAAEVHRNKGGRPRKWATDKERVAAAVKTYRAKKKAQKCALPS